MHQDKQTSTHLEADLVKAGRVLQCRVLLVRAGGIFRFGRRARDEPGIGSVHLRFAHHKTHLNKAWYPPRGSRSRPMGRLTMKLDAPGATVSTGALGATVSTGATDASVSTGATASTV